MVVAVVTVVAMVTVVLVVVVDVALSVISVNIISVVVLVVTVVAVTVTMSVVVVVVMMMMVVVVVVVVLNVLELLGQLVDETLINGLLEFDLVLVVLKSVDHGVVETVLDLEPQFLTLQLVLELLDSLSAEGVVVVVVAVMTVVVAVVSVVMKVVSVVVTVMAVVLVVVVGMRMLVVVGMDMDGSVGVDLLSGDRGKGDVSRVLVVVMNMTRGVVRIPLGNIVTVRINLGVSGDGLGQGGGETEKGNGDEGGLHIGCSKGLIEWKVWKLDEGAWHNEVVWE
jgi:hypothetical protein